MELIKTNQLYVDMDNVLVDFDTRVKTVLYNRWNKEAGYDSKEYADAIRDGLFLNLDPMPDMYDLWQAVEEHNPILLSSTAHVHVDVVKLDKRRWVDKYLGEDVKLITVSHSAEKAEYAVSQDAVKVDGLTPNLLIDDWDRAFVPFRNAGGEAIQHFTAAKTIEDLRNVYGIRDHRLSEYK